MLLLSPLTRAEEGLRSTAPRYPVCAGNCHLFWWTEHSRRTENTDPVPRRIWNTFSPRDFVNEHSRRTENTDPVPRRIWNTFSPRDFVVIRIGVGMGIPSTWLPRSCTSLCLQWLPADGLKPLLELEFKMPPDLLSAPVRLLLSFFMLVLSPLLLLSRTFINRFFPVFMRW